MVFPFASLLDQISGNVSGSVQALTVTWSSKWALGNETPKKLVLYHCNVPHLLNGVISHATAHCGPKFQHWAKSNFETNQILGSLFSK